MIFGKTDVHSAEGSILAHSLRVCDGRIRKGTVLSKEHIKQLIRSGIDAVTVAQLEPGDVQEDNAAALLANALVGDGIKLGEASTGRVNCYAQHTGLLTIPRDRLLACNAVSESITASTLPENRWVEAGKMVATIKIIPYAVEEHRLDSAIAAVGAPIGNEQDPLQRICVFQPTARHAHLVQTTLPNTPAKLLDKTVRVTQRRLNLRNVSLDDHSQCAHSIEALAMQLKSIAAQQETLAQDTHGGSQHRVNHWILISGASAISDRRDVIPQALEQAGGNVLRCGIPVDPGNLLMLGQLGNSTVIGIPGCARSPKHNGLDLFMDRLACNLAINNDWINSLAIGGLMDEIIDRPQPRIKTDKHERVTAILLAGGSSQRFGVDNKLLAKKGDRSLIHHALHNITRSQINQLIIVVGHDADVVEQHCREFFQDNTQANDVEIEFVVNTDFDSGMASSLRAGVSQLLNRNMNVGIENAHAAMVFLADMPDVLPATTNALIAALETHAQQTTLDGDKKPVSAIVPTCKQSRGNPVILMPELFDLLLDVAGDVGARQLLRANPDAVLEVDVDDSGILADYDTPEQLHGGPR